MEHQDMVKLRRILVEYFDDEDLKTLCFDLNIDHENLPATNKAGRSREIVLSCQRSGRLDELYAAVRSIRPNAFREDKEDTPPTRPEQPNAVDSSTSLNPHVSRGTTLTTSSGKRYFIESNFYSGATATLYRATNENNEAVMVKVFWRGLMPDSPAWHLFNQEQKAAEILRHKNIVQIHDRGLHVGYPFTVMEYLGGGTLRDWMQAHVRMRGPDIVAVAAQIAEAIDFAHQNGVIHRDIKPGNILFESSPQDRVALGDFGIARILGAVQQDITTAPGLDITGSPAYLAPETISGNVIDKPADIYSFGVVLFEMLCGRTPFDEQQTTYSMLFAKTQKDAPSIQDFRPDIQKSVAGRIGQLLSRDPSARPKSAKAFLLSISAQITKL